MVEVKVMPYSEKYAKALDTIKVIETFVPPFIQKHLGDAAVAELQSIWKEGAKPIPEGASDEEKYEVAYDNFIWMAKNDLSFVRGHMGEEGIELFKRAEVEALKKENASPALFLLKLIRAVSTSTAFTMTAKQMAYQMQWITPYSVSELSRQRAVYDMPRCKVLDYPDTEDLCAIGCQKIYATWFSEQFKVKQETNRQGNSCIMTITPL
jgi:hypothetical protein